MLNGTYTWNDGKQYVGTFKDGLMDGNGLMTWPDGKSYKGNI